jgi:hypothetical protein
MSALQILIQKEDYVETELDESFVDEEEVLEDDFQIEEPVVVPEGYERSKISAPKELYSLVEGELVDEDESDGNYEASEEDEHDSEDDMDEEEEEL